MELPPQYNLKVHNLIELREWIIYDMSEPVLQAQNKSIDKDRIKAILNGLNFAQSSSFPKWLTNKVCVRSLQLNMDTCFDDLHSVNPWCHPRCVDVFLHLPASVFLLRLNKEIGHAYQIVLVIIQSVCPLYLANLCGKFLPQHEIIF